MIDSVALRRVQGMSPARLIVCLLGTTERVLLQVEIARYTLFGPVNRYVE